MTGTRWEYASVAWTDAMRKITKADPEYQKLSPEVRREWDEKEWAFYWWRDQTYFVWRPGAKEAEVRHSWSTGESTYETSGLDLLNELGAEGWEVVSQEVRASAVGSNLGRDTASYPIQFSTLLKRPVA